MDKVQEHIEKVREALEEATPGIWWHYQTNNSVVSDHKDFNWGRKTIANCHTFVDAHLLANSPTWHQTSLDIIEQQQREIDSKDELLERILKIYINHKEAKYHNPTSIDLIGKLVEMHLNPNKEVSTDVQNDR